MSRKRNKRTLKDIIDNIGMQIRFVKSAVLIGSILAIITFAIILFICAYINCI